MENLYSSRYSVVAEKLVSLINNKGYNEAWSVLKEFVVSEESALLSASNQNNVDRIADYFKRRDESGQFYGHLVNYINPKKQLRFQRVRKHKFICKLLYPSVRGQADDFFSDRYYYDAKRFVIDMEPRQKEYVKYIDYYSRLFEKFCDEISIRTYLCIIAAGIFEDYEFYEMALCDSSVDYFPTDIFQMPCNEVIVDCGGYTGDTFEWFLHKFGAEVLKGYYLYEPDKDNAQIAAKKRVIFENLYVKAAAVSDKDGWVLFDSNGESGQLSKVGGEEVLAITLDGDIPEKVSFVKMDIEGSELLALRGARNHIATEKPKLAVCAYHKPDDLRVLIEEIESINANYNFFIRHYSPKHKETVIYCR